MKSLQYLFIVGLLFSSIGYSQTVPSYEPTNGLVAAGDLNFGTETTTFKLLVDGAKKKRELIRRITLRVISPY
jgi:hypothetical protein